MQLGIALKRIKVFFLKKIQKIFFAVTNGVTATLLRYACQNKKLKGGDRSGFENV